MPDALNSREGPQEKKPSKCLTGQSYGERRQRPSNCQLQEAKTNKQTKKQKNTHSDRALTPASEAVHVPAHLALPGSCHKPSSCTTFMLNSHQGRAATGKKRCLASMCAGSLWSCSTLCDLVDCGLPGFSVREEGFPDKNTGVYWPILLAMPS